MMTREALRALLQPAVSVGEAEVRTRRAVAECYELHDNLTATQTRCTELLEEKRALAAELRALKPGVYVNEPNKGLRALFVLGSTAGGAALAGSGGLGAAIIGALAGAVIGFAATGDRSP